MICSSMRRQAFKAGPTGQSQGANRIVVMRARAQSGDGNAPLRKAAAFMLGTGLALSISAAPALAAPQRLEQRREEQEAALVEQMRKVEYAIQQQENVRKAELVSKRQVLENQVDQAEVAIQRKLVEELANEKAAEAKGEEARALRIQAEEQQIKAQEAALQVAAAKAKAQLEAAEIAEQAKEVEQKQNVEKAANSILDLLGLTEADLGLSEVRM